MNTEPTMPLFSWGDIPGNDSLRYTLLYMTLKLEPGKVIIWREHGVEQENGQKIKVSAC